MKKLVLVSFMVALLMSVMALAQDTTKQDNQMKQDNMKADKTSTKAISISGKVSDDGQTFVSDKDNKSWTVGNPDALKGHEGHRVTLKAHADADKNEITVLSVKMGKAELKNTTKKDDTQK